MQNYLRDPDKIECQTFDRIRELTNLDRFSSDEKQVVLHMVRTCGNPALAEKIRFSPNAIEVGKKAIKKYACMLYDFETVKCGLNEELLYQEPMCFINKAAVISQAKASKQTRAMTAVDHWKNYSKDAITIIGHSGTALARLLELLKDKQIDQPALIIATPPGFVNAEAAKQALLDQYDESNTEYISITGETGGCMLAAATMNALLMIQKEIYI
ncbi:MAG: precorrin-8X methylmutase [Thiolinea sp.]